MKNLPAYSLFLVLIITLSSCSACVRASLSSASRVRAARQVVKAVNSQTRTVKYVPRPAKVMRTVPKTRTQERPLATERGVNNRTFVNTGMKAAGLDFKLYDTYGNVVARSRSVTQLNVDQAFQRAMQRQAGRVLNNAYYYLRSGQAYSEAELQHILRNATIDALEAEVGSNFTYRLHLGSGELSLFYRAGSGTIDGTINIYKAMKINLIRAGGGYVLYKTFS